MGERGESWDHHCEPDVAWTSEDDVWREFDVLRALEGTCHHSLSLSALKSDIGYDE